MLAKSLSVHLSFGYGEWAVCRVCQAVVCEVRDSCVLASEASGNRVIAVRILIMNFGVEPLSFLVFLVCGNNSAGEINIASVDGNIADFNNIPASVCVAILENAVSFEIVSARIGGHIEHSAAI